MNHAIQLTDVTKQFGKQVAVDGLNLTVPTRSIYGFIGPNGSGKTTTLRMILRIFQPESGRVTVLGNDCGTAADNRLGYLPEERGLYKRMRVRELLTYYARLKGAYQCQENIDHWLDVLEATEWQHKRIDALSKGMAQKIQFIAAVVAKPELVILDEPFSGLDPINMEALRDAVVRLRDQGTTVIFSTHDMDMAEKLCDTIFMIFKGRKVLDGTLEDIQAQYPLNRIRARFEDIEFSPELTISEIESCHRVGKYMELTLREFGQAQLVLQKLADQATIEHFEVVRPSLHDIFVRIARPRPEEMLVR